MMNDLVIQALTLSYWYPAARFLVEAFPEYTQKQISALLRRNDLYGLLLLEDGSLRGLALSHWLERSDIAWVHSVAVLPECSRQGWGRRLVLGLEEYWQKLGAQTIQSRSLSSNQASRRMFFGAGYQRFESDLSPDLVFKNLPVRLDLHSQQQRVSSNPLWKRRLKKLFYLVWVQSRLSLF